MYALPIIFDEVRNEYLLAVARIVTPHRPEGKYHLIGGAIEAKDRDHVDTLEREFLEEIGVEIVIGDYIHRVDEFVNATTQRFDKEGYFYEATIKEKVQDPIELDHELVWLPLNEARTSLHHACARHIVDYWMTHHT